jgi:superfamily II DNA or RNA helicase
VIRELKREARSWGVFTTARVAGQQRKEILRDFGEGNFDFLVAIRCLDEGVDIPGAVHALILASNRTEREFIQRRGRILRRAPGKELSVIHDPVVVPFSLDDDGHPIGVVTDSEAQIITRELHRVELFAAAADNDVEALGFIYTVRSLLKRALAQADGQQGG